MANRFNDLLRLAGHSRDPRQRLQSENPSLKNSRRNRQNCSQPGLRSGLRQGSPDASVSRAAISLAEFLALMDTESLKLEGEERRR